MIQVDYSGLNWRLLGKKVNKVHIGGVKVSCFGDIYFNEQFQSYFCTSCGCWLTDDKKIKKAPKRPKTAIDLLLILEQIQGNKKEKSK